MFRNLLRVRRLPCLLTVSATHIILDKPYLLAINVRQAPAFSSAETGITRCGRRALLAAELAYFFRRPLSLPRATFSPPPKLPNSPHSCRGSTVPVSCLQLSTWSIRNQSAEAEGCVGRRSAAGPLSLRVNCRASQANHRRNFLASPATRIPSSPVTSSNSTPLPLLPIFSQTHPQRAPISTHPWSTRRRVSTGHLSPPHGSTCKASSWPIVTPSRRPSNGLVVCLASLADVTPL